MMERSYFFADEAGTLALGAALAGMVCPGDVVLLRGDLGAGKTTVARGFLRALGHAGTVKSPTYALAETYEFPTLCVAHLDLYRLSDAGELEFIGLDQWLSERYVLLVEWPDIALEFLPAAAIDVRLEHAPGGREATVRFEARSDWVDRLTNLEIPSG